MHKFGSRTTGPGKYEPAEQVEQNEYGESKIWIETLTKELQSEVEAGRLRQGMDRNTYLALAHGNTLTELIELNN